MKVTEKSYQKTIELLDEIQQSVTDGMLSKNTRQCLLSIGGAVLQIRQTLNEGVFISDGGDTA